MQQIQVTPNIAQVRQFLDRYRVRQTLADGRSAVPVYARRRHDAEIRPADRARMIQVLEVASGGVVAQARLELNRRASDPLLPFEAQFAGEIHDRRLLGEARADGAFAELAAVGIHRSCLGREDWLDPFVEGSALVDGVKEARAERLLEGLWAGIWALALNLGLERLYAVQSPVMSAWARSSQFLFCTVGPRRSLASGWAELVMTDRALLRSGAEEARVFFINELREQLAAFWEPGMALPPRHGAQ